MGWDWGWVMTFPLVSSLGWGVEYDRPSLNPFCFSENFFLLFAVCEIFRAHEMHSQLEVTEMLECKTYRNTLLHFQVLDRTPAFLQCVHPFCMAGCGEFNHQSKWQREPRTPSLVPRLSPWKVTMKPFVITVQGEPGNEAKVLPISYCATISAVHTSHEALEMVYCRK